MSTLLTLLLACRSEAPVSNESPININGHIIETDQGITAKATDEEPISQLTAIESNSGYNIVGAIPLQGYSPASGQPLSTEIEIEFDESSTLFEADQTLKAIVSGSVNGEPCLEGQEIWLAPDFSTSTESQLTYSGVIENNSTEEKCISVFGDFDSQFSARFPKLFADSSVETD